MIDLTLDFETHFNSAEKYSLRNMTTVEYIRDPRFHVQMCGVLVGGGDQGLAQALGPQDTATMIGSVDWSQINLIGHNLMFDGAILAWHYGVKPARYTDTLAMARAMIGTVIRTHGLGDVAEYLGMGGKLEDGAALRSVDGVRDLTPSQFNELAQYCALHKNSDVHLTRQIYDRLAVDFPKSELDIVDWSVRTYCTPQLDLDLQKLRGYEDEVRREKAEAVRRTGLTRSDFMSNDRFAAHLRLLNVDVPMKKSITTGKKTYAFAKSDVAFLDMAAEHPNERVRLLCDTRLHVKSTIEETRARTMGDVAMTGTLPVLHNYSGALNTHRLSGGGGYNVQNFKRGGTLRDSICAPEGHKLVVLDHSGIELRTAFALCNDTLRTQQVRDGVDIYCETATGLFHTPVFPDTHERFIPRMKEQRTVGKVADLSLQYGAGAGAFQKMLRAMAQLNWPEAECRNIVTGWRGQHPLAQAMWKNLDSAIKLMADGQQVQDIAIDTAGGKPVFWFQPEGILLPRGLQIKYPDINLHHFEEDTFDDEGVYVKTVERKEIRYRDMRSTGGWAKLYGAKVFENLCQALATCIYMECLKAVNAFWPVAMSVHDEVVLVVPNEKVEPVLTYATLLMETRPTWWPDFPLKVEGGVAETYGDAK